jgi:hypothetical protein
MVPPLQKTVWLFLKKLHMELSFDPAIPLLGAYQRKRKPYAHIKTCTNVHSSLVHNSPNIEATQMSIN